VNWNDAVRFLFIGIYNLMKMGPHLIVKSTSAMTASLDIIIEGSWDSYLIPTYYFITSYQTRECRLVLFQYGPIGGRLLRPKTSVGPD